MDQEDENLKMALKMSLFRQNQTAGVYPGGGAGRSSPEARSRRELMAAAAERRMMAVASPSKSPAAVPKKAEKATGSPSVVSVGAGGGKDEASWSVEERKGSGVVREELALGEVDQLFSMVFGTEASKDILAQWSNQGISDYLGCPNCY